MKTLAEFARSELMMPDVPDIETGDWLIVPFGCNRDSDLLTMSNYDTALARLGGAGDDVQVFESRSWATGWVRSIIVRPGSEAAKTAAELVTSAASYPALDDRDLSRREQELYLDCWRDWGKHDFITGLSDNLGLSEDQCDRLDEADDIELRALFERLSNSGNYQERGLPQVGPSVHAATVQDVEVFLANHTPEAPVP